MLTAAPSRAKARAGSSGASNASSLDACSSCLKQPHCTHRLIPLAPREAAFHLDPAPVIIPIHHLHPLTDIEASWMRCVAVY
jgi:hypothetical protein